MRNSLAAMGGCYGARSALPPATVHGVVNNAPATEPCPNSRFEALSKALDREAMQRGWARTVDPDYHHAPESAIEAFKDLKFGIRIHWGLYCLIGSHESWGLAGANAEFWNIYNILYEFFDPTDFNADTWMDLFQRAGIRFFTFTTKHHDGFCLWPTQTTQPSIRLTPRAFMNGCEYTEAVTHHYSVMESPYQRDIVGALVAAARRKDIKIGLYYSHVDWHDPAFAWDPFSCHYDPSFTRHSDPPRWQRFIEQERAQVGELMTQYGRIDTLDFDIGWPEDAAREIAEIAKMVRRLQPEIIMRDRGIGAYGDYYTPEREIPGGPSKEFWKVIYPCGTSFSYIPGDEYHPAEWILESLITTCAKGGNFEVGFGPMPSGAWAPEAVERLEYVGAWLKVNGEAIYNTRPRRTFREGDSTWFTASRDGRFVYAISLKWPGSEFTLRSVRALRDSQVFMLGVGQPLMWQQHGEALSVRIPPEVAEHRPCRQAYVFRIEVERG